MSDSFPMPLDAKEEEYYLKLFQDGDEDARRVLIERNLRLVAHIAKKYTATGSGPDDLISIGTIGLIKAVNTYRSGRSTRLATYAAKCIDNEILMSLRAGKKNKGDISLDEPLGTDKDGNEISFNDILGSDPDSIIDDIDLKMQVHALYEAVMSELTPREKYVIVHRYGICNCECQAQREIADSLGISRSYVSRIEKKALEKLREKLEQ